MKVGDLVIAPNLYRTGGSLAIITDIWEAEPVDSCDPEMGINVLYSNGTTGTWHDWHVHILAKEKLYDSE